MILLIISILALLPGPVIYHSIRRACWARGFLDSFLLISIGGLVLLHILPFGLTHGGTPALPVFALGITIPILFHRYTGVERLNSLSPFLIPALIAIALHSLLDGLALREQGRDGGKILAMAVVLHRLPVGLLIWWMIRPRSGTPIAVAVLVVIITATLFGYFYEAPFSGGEKTIALIQMLVAGSLVHVLYHHTPGPDFADCDHIRHRQAAWLGTIAAIAVLVIISLLSVSDHGEEADVLGYSISHALRIAPPLVAAALLSFLPGFFLIRRRPEGDRSTIQLSDGGADGSAGTIIDIFPDFGLGAFFVAWILFNFSMAIYLTLWFALLFILFRLIIKIPVMKIPDDGGKSGQRRIFSTVSSERGGVRGGLGFVFDRNPQLIYPWVIVGILLAVLIDFLLGNNVIGRPGWVAGTGLLLIIGFILNLNPLAALFIAAALFGNGLSPQLIPPIVLTLSVFHRLLFQAVRRKFSVARTVMFFIFLFSLIAGAGFGVDFFPDFRLPAPFRPADPIWEPGVNLGALILLGAIILRTLTRLGPREFLDQILPSQKPGDNAG